MRVLFDHQILDERSPGGISRYFGELAVHLRDYGLVEVCFPPLRTDNPHLARALPASSFRLDSMLSRAFDALERLGLGTRKLRQARRHARRRRNRRASVAALAAGEFDVFHPTYYDPYFLAHLRGRPFVLTLYDMIHERFSEHYRRDDPTGERKRGLAAQAKRIVAISGTTAADATRLLGVDSRKVDVIPLGTPVLAAPEPVEVPPRFVLHVGDRHRYKNFARLLRAFGDIGARFPGVSLVITGPAPADDERALLGELGLAGRCVHVAASEPQLAFLYSRAALLAYPSLAEGFGLPLLEAFAAGCPVACSDAPALPELAGDAAILFDPLDEGGIAAALTRLLVDESLRATMIARGRDRARRFTWEATARATAAVYARALAGA